MRLMQCALKRTARTVNRFCEQQMRMVKNVREISLAENRTYLSFGWMNFQKLFFRKNGKHLSMLLWSLILIWTNQPKVIQKTNVSKQKKHPVYNVYLFFIVLIFSNLNIFKIDSNNFSHFLKNVFCKTATVLLWKGVLSDGDVYGDDVFGDRAFGSSISPSAGRCLHRFHRKANRTYRTGQSLWCFGSF